MHIFNLNCVIWDMSPPDFWKWVIEILHLTNLTAKEGNWFKIVPPTDMDFSTGETGKIASMLHDLKPIAVMDNKWQHL